MSRYSVKLPHLKEWRKKRYWTQAMLADFAGVNRVTVLMLENEVYGARISTVRLLAEVLYISPQQLVEESPK